MVAPATVQARSSLEASSSARDATLALLDGLPPLRSLRGKKSLEKVAALETRHLALLAACLVAAPVRLVTVHAPRSNHTGNRTADRTTTTGGAVTATAVGTTMTTDAARQPPADDDRQTRHEACHEAATTSSTSGSGRGLQALPWAEVAVVCRSPSWHFDRLARQHGVREAFHG